MPSFSVRMLVIFLCAAVFINVSNYTYIKLYKPPVPLNRGLSRKFIRLRYRTNDILFYSSSASTRFTINSKSWSDRLLCGVNATNSQICLKLNSTPPFVYYNNMYESVQTESTACPDIPPGLGLVREDGFATTPTMEAFASIYNEIKPGGIYNTTTCISLHSVAIIVAFRGLRSSLASFLYTIHPFLMKQQLNYQIFVVEQSNTSRPFNRGKLLNVGFMVAKNHHWDCYIFHGSNIVPMDTRNLYRCSWFPRQLAITVERPPLPPFQPKFGGAVAMTSEQFLKVNGFSNSYWGNDADYNDLYNRLSVINYPIENTEKGIGKYRALKNVNTPARLQSKMIETVAPSLYLTDGITTLSYTIANFELRPLYTHIIVNIDDAEESPSFTELAKEVTLPNTGSNINTEANTKAVNVTH